MFKRKHFFYFSIPLDQLESSSTEYDAMNDYLRLFLTSGQLESNYSCGITYEDFLGGGYFQCFDLTTSQEPGLTYSVPSVRVVKYTLLNFIACFKIDILSASVEKIFLINDKY